MIFSVSGFYHCWKGSPGQFSIYYTRITVLWPLIMSAAALEFTIPLFCVSICLRPQRLHRPKIRHSDVVCDPFIGRDTFLAFYTNVFQFLRLFQLFWYHSGGVTQFVVLLCLRGAVCHCQTQNNFLIRSKNVS